MEGDGDTGGEGKGWPWRLWCGVRMVLGLVQSTRGCRLPNGVQCSTVGTLCAAHVNPLTSLSRITLVIRAVLCLQGAAVLLRCLAL